MNQNLRSACMYIHSSIFVSSSEGGWGYIRLKVAECLNRNLEKLGCLGPDVHVHI